MVSIHTYKYQLFYVFELGDQYQIYDISSRYRSHSYKSMSSILHQLIPTCLKANQALIQNLSLIVSWLL